VKRVASTRIDVKPGHVDQLGDQSRVDNLNRASTGRASQGAPTHRQRLANIGIKSMRSLDPCA
jgi:hypothetical protein